LLHIGTQRTDLRAIVRGPDGSSANFGIRDRAGAYRCGLGQQTVASTA
jgi:hypothetical protein